MSERTNQVSNGASPHPLSLCIEEIRSAVSASDQGVNSLMHNFMEVATLIDGLVATLERNSGSGAMEPVVAQTAQIKALMNDSVQSFQFYDRLTQQLDHVVVTLEKILSRQSGDCPEVRRWHDTTPENKSGETSVELF